MSNNFTTGASPSSSAYASALAGTLFLLGFASHTQAAPLTFKNTPASEAAAQIGKAFNVSLDIKPGIDMQRKVTFSVPDTGAKDALLNTVNSFATAVGADFRKEFIISTLPDNASPQVPLIDASDARINFDDQNQTTAKALAAVGSMDDASTVVGSPLQTFISFTGTELTIQDAVKQIESQTHSQWTVAYLLTPHTNLNSSPGRVVGYTAEGQPIIELLTIKFPENALPSGGPGVMDAAGDSDGTQPTMQSPQNQAGPPLSPDQLQSFIYRSAFSRGDISAMRKFQNGSPSGASQQPGQ